MAEGIRLLETLVLNGPNYWSYRPCVWMRIDLGPFQESPSNEIPGFAEKLARLLPGLEEHHCSEGEKGGFLKRMREGTWLGHVAEHVAIEIQQEVGIPVSFGRTRETKTPGVYNLVYEMEEERVGVRAGKLALDVVEHCAGLDIDLDLPASLDKLKKTRDRWALGPSTRSIVATAAARGIPHLRLNNRSLVMLGTGVQVASLGITSGCGNGNYCPDQSVTREQMAVFLLKTLFGAGYAPPTAAGIFQDVALNSNFINWIEDLYHHGITGGCQGPGQPLQYCPGSPNTREQMAVFVTRTFGLQ